MIIPHSDILLRVCSYSLDLVMATGARGEDLYYQLLYESYVPTATDDRSRPTSSSRRGREDVLPWEDYFMALALLAAQRSEDPVTKVSH